MIIITQDIYLDQIVAPSNASSLTPGSMPKALYTTAKTPTPHAILPSRSKSSNNGKKRAFSLFVDLFTNKLVDMVTPPAFFHHRD